MATVGSLPVGRQVGSQPLEIGAVSYCFKRNSRIRAFAHLHIRIFAHYYSFLKLKNKLDL
jgi:hypothetical protein